MSDTSANVASTPDGLGGSDVPGVPGDAFCLALGEFTIHDNADGVGQLGHIYVGERNSDHTDNGKEYWYFEGSSLPASQDLYLVWHGGHTPPDQLPTAWKEQIHIMQTAFSPIIPPQNRGASLAPGEYAIHMTAGMAHRGVVKVEGATQRWYTDANTGERLPPESVDLRWYAAGCFNSNNPSWNEVVFTVASAQPAPPVVEG